MDNLCITEIVMPTACNAAYPIGSTPSSTEELLPLIVL